MKNNGCKNTTTSTTNKLTSWLMQLGGSMPYSRELYPYPEPIPPPEYE